jgi:hypothetical protein
MSAMPESKAAAIVSTTMSQALAGSATVEVSTEGFRPYSMNMEAMLSIGDDGRILQMLVDGWGAAFERRRIACQIVIDLRWNTDELIKAVLKKEAGFVSSQCARRIRASASGIAKPLDAETFTDLGRLKIDIAVARALHDQFGSDEAVRDWMTEQLRMFMGRYDKSCVLQMHGFTVAVPIALPSLEVIPDRTAIWNRPCWIDDMVSITQYTPSEGDDARAAIIRMLEDTPLRGRTLLDASVYPTDEMQQAIAKTRARRGMDDGDERPPERNEWRFAVEPRLVSFVEAFG